MVLFIVTGGSKGLGNKICMEILRRGHCVVNISRSKPRLRAMLNLNESMQNFTHIKADLSKGLSSINKIKTQLAQINLQNIKKIILINNAALIEPVGVLHNLDPQLINTHLVTNFVAPVLLTQSCVNLALKKKKDIVVFNIGSGAAFRPIEGWSMYCSTKAGLKMFTENLALDFARNKKVKFFHFSPGVMDTQMQAKIRDFKAQDFPRVREFKNMKKNNTLRDPESVAYALIEFCLKIKNNYQGSSGLSIEDLEIEESKC